MVSIVFQPPRAKNACAKNPLGKSTSIACRGAVVDVSTKTEVTNNHCKSHFANHQLPLLTLSGLHMRSRKPPPAESLLMSLCRRKLLLSLRRRWEW